MAEECTDSVQLFSAHIKALRNTGEKIFITRSEREPREEEVEKIIHKLKQPETTEDEKRKLLKNLWLNVCFYIIRELKKSNLSKDLFDDALQNTYLTLATKAHKYEPYYNPNFKTTFAGFITRSKTISNSTNRTLKSGHIVRLGKASRQDLLSDAENNPGLTITQYEDYKIKDEHKAPSAERGVYNRELHNLFSEIFSTNKILNSFEKTAVLGKFGLLGHQQMDLKELQDNFASRGKKVTIARISQIQKEGITKIRHYLEKIGVDSKII